MSSYSQSAWSSSSVPDPMLSNPDAGGLHNSEGRSPRQATVLEQRKRATHLFDLDGLELGSDDHFLIIVGLPTCTHC
jgi:hypothetical protein